MTVPASNNSPAPAADGNASGLIEFFSSSIHGMGARATADIADGAQIIEYTGRRISKEESRLQCEADNRYIFYLDDEWDLDGNAGWNPAKFINHSCDPNCEAQLEGGRIWIISIRPIGAGEEITFNYGYDWEDHLDHPCRCGTAACVGYIVSSEYFPRLRAGK